MTRAGMVAVAAAVALLAAAPFIAEVFYLDLLTRVLILAIAVVSLNLIVGGGMVSLGHAAYLGIGAYSVGIPAHYGVYDGALHLALAVSASAVFALLTGAVCLRTRGLYFILITLAFAQMLYFTFVSMDEFGADDGLLIDKRSEFALINLENPITLYYTVLTVLIGCLFLIHRLTHAGFGRVIAGCRHNQERMQALGYDTYKYKLVCYVIAGAMCGVAGFLLGNFTDFISPEMMDWTRSAELLFILVVGGVGALTGPVIGAAAFVFLEDFLSGVTVYWHLIFGLLLIALVLFVGKGGLHGLIKNIIRSR